VTDSTVPAARVSTNALVLLAYKRAGIVPVEARLSGANMVPKLEHGRQVLDLIMDSLATKGFIARTSGFHDLAMVAGEPYYTLPDDILDVHGEAMFVPADNPDTKHTSGELVCKQIDQMAWALLTTKGSISTRPQLYCVFRHAATVNLRFWPVPSEPGVMRLRTTRLFGGAGDGQKSADMERFWYDALVWQLAYYLAVDSTMPPASIQLLQMTAEAKVAECVKFSFEHTASIQAVVDYQTQWSR
jgi:hypothetical protein